MENFYTNFYFIYAFFTLIIFFDLLGGYSKSKLLYLKFQNLSILIFLGAYYLLLSTRSLNAGADTQRYFSFYRSMYNYRDYIVGSDLGFNIFNKLLVGLGIHPSIYLYFVSLLFVVPIYFTFKQFKSINKVFKEYEGEIKELVKEYDLPEFNFYTAYYYELASNFDYQKNKRNETLNKYFKIYSNTYNLEKFYKKNNLFFRIFYPYKII